MDPNITLILQMMNDKLNKLDEKIDKTLSRLDVFMETLKETNLNVQVLTRYIEETEQSQLQKPKPQQFPFPQVEPTTHKTNMLFPQFEEQEQEPGPQGDNWTGGFGGLSNFNPLIEQVNTVSTFDYSPRPIKNKDSVDKDTDIIYLYEQKNGLEIDHDDLEEAVEKIEKEGDKQAFIKALKNITNGIKTIYSSRDPQLYFESIGIMGRSVELRYNKLTSSSNNTSYNKLFN